MGNLFWPVANFLNFRSDFIQLPLHVRPFPPDLPWFSADFVKIVELIRFLGPQHRVAYVAACGTTVQFYDKTTSDLKVEAKMKTQRRRSLRAEF